MDGTNLASISLRPGGGTAANPFTAFTQGAGVKSAPQKGVLAPSATPHTALLEERKKELGVDMMKYSAKYMLQFAERYSRAPAGLHSVKGLMVDDVTKNQVVQKAVQSDTDNWRSNMPSTAGAPSAAGGGGDSNATATNTASTNQNTSAAARHASGVPTPSPALAILKAEDVGRQKWAPAKGLESSAQAQQKLRGILNKLTPDNFDRLLTQVLGIMSVSTEVLRKCIPLLFEKAVAEPKFCALYADLSAILSKELASHDFGSSEGKPISFKRELLNTCQDEFEGMEDQREKIRTGDGNAAELEMARRKLKMRQLGTLRLLAELFNRDLLTPPIMKIVTAELLNRSKTAGVYDSELIECVVQAIAISGQKMSKNEKMSKPLKQWLATLAGWSDDMSLEARIRFKIKDLQDQIAAGWYSRMDANTVKKTEEIRKQAETELGIVSSTPALPDFLPGLNIGPAFPQVAAAKRDQSALFPEVDNAYGMPIPDGLQPMPDLRPDQPDAAKDTSGPSVAVGSTPDEDVRKKAHGTFQEFMSIRDFTEAETCMRELALSVAQQGLVVATALNDSYDVQLETERDNLRAVVVHLADTGLLVAEGIQAGIQEHMAQLDDLAVDIPLAPPILGKFLAALLEQGTMPTSVLETFFDASEMAEAKRAVFKHLMRTLETSLGQAPAAELLTKGDVHIGPFLDADKTLEPALPSVFDFVKMEKLEWVPL